MGYHPSHFALTFWTIWFISWFSTFITYEVWQIAAGRPQNTLSAAVWHMLGVVRGQPITQWSFFHLFFIGLFVLTMAWLTGHFGWMDWT
jgi:hypothetical protein